MSSTVSWSRPRRASRCRAACRRRFRDPDRMGNEPVAGLTPLVGVVPAGEDEGASHCPGRWSRREMTRGCEVGLRTLMTAIRSSSRDRSKAVRSAVLADGSVAGANAGYVSARFRGHDRTDRRRRLPVSLRLGLPVELAEKSLAALMKPG